MHSEKDEVDGADIGKTVYSFGSRFHVDVSYLLYLWFRFCLMQDPISMAEPWLSASPIYLNHSGYFVTISQNRPFLFVSS